MKYFGLKLYLQIIYIGRVEARVCKRVPYLLVSYRWLAVLSLSHRLLEGKLGNENEKCLLEKYNNCN